MKKNAPTARPTSVEIDSLRSLDNRAVAEIHDRHYPAVFRYIRFRVADDQLAEDLTSDVFVRLIESVQQGKAPHTTVLGWLMGTAANLVADHYRGSFRHPSAPLSDQIPAKGPQPDDLAARNETGRHLRQALDSLTPEQQDVISMRFGAGMSLEQTAASLGKDPNAVKALQFRAMTALRRKMQDGPE